MNNRVLGAMFLAASVTILVAGFALFADRSTAIDCPREPAKLPGLRMELCAWPASARTDDWFFGREQRTDPGGRGRFQAVSWSTSEPSPVEQEIAIFAQLFGTEKTEVEERASIQVNGHDGDEVLIDLGGRPIRFSSWYCDVDGRHLRVESFMNGDARAIATLHREIVATARCHADPKLAPVFPSFEVPAGWERTEYPSHLWLEGEAGIFSISMGTRDPNFVERVHADPNLRRLILQEELGLDDVQEDATPRRLGERTAWRGTASREGAALQVMLTAFRCPSQLGFVVVYSGSEGGVAAAEGLLGGMKCPGR